MYLDVVVEPPRLHHVVAFADKSISSPAQWHTVCSGTVPKPPLSPSLHNASFACFALSPPCTHALLQGCGSKHHLSWDCPDNPQIDKKKTNRKEVSSAVVAEPESDDKGESPDLAPAAEPRGGGKGGTPVIAAASGGKAKRGKADNPGARARGDPPVCPSSSVVVSLALLFFWGGTYAGIRCCVPCLD